MEGGFDIIFFILIWISFIFSIPYNSMLYSIIAKLSFIEFLSNIWHIYYDESGCDISVLSCIFDSYEITVMVFSLINVLLQIYWISYKEYNGALLIWIIVNVGLYIGCLITSEWEEYNKYSTIISAIRIILIRGMGT